MKVIFAASVLLYSFAAGAQQFSDWNVSRDGDYITAEVSNDSGGSFGLLCDVESQNCIWGIIQKDACNKGEQYPVLINSDVGATLTYMSCGDRAKDGTYVLTFTDFSVIEETVKKGSRIGFAIPLANGNFRVNRFSLIGSSAAVSAANQNTVNAKAKSTRDIVL